MVNLVAASVDSLETKTEFPYKFDIKADIKIPLSDGCWLHARAWMPVDANLKPVPAVVEYAPFRHRDFTAPRDALIHPWFAGHGYASLRVELRGSGDSGGMPNDEYVLQEQTDALEALEWISNQQWCSGNTGMFGMSWGAFSALQIAEHNPPSLKAIIPVHGTDDRFADDIHYKGGCLLTAGLSWGTLYTLYMMRPQDPEISGDSWRETWLDRFDQCPLVLEEWMNHQYKDDYWKHGSISQNYSNIQCPTLVVCGWADGYSNAAMRMAEHLPEPGKVIVGPWAHTYPHLAQPGPQAGFLQEAVNWWDRWLKGIANKVEGLPRLRVWLQESVPPASSYESRDGRWLGFDSWPSPTSDTKRWYFHPQKLTTFTANENVIQTIKSPLSNAINGPEWLPHGVGPKLPIDQNHEDNGSLCFDTEPLDTDINICGKPIIRLKLRCNVQSGIVCVRLNDIFEDGQATQISYGVLNLNHRNGLDKPEPLIRDKWIDVELCLNDIAQQIPKGHRMRLAISTQAWPLVWPAAEIMALEMQLDNSSLQLPILDCEAIQQLATPQPPKASIPKALSLEWLRPVKRERIITHDLETNETGRVYLKDDGAYLIKEHSMEIDAQGKLTYKTREEDPLSATAIYEYQIKHSRGTWNAAIDCKIKVTCDSDYFYITGEYRALENDQVIRQRKVNQSVKRQHV